MKFAQWFRTFLSEKGYDLSDDFFIVKTWKNEHMIEGGVLRDAILDAPAHEQAAIKSQLVRIDFLNAPLRPFFLHLAGAMAKVMDGPEPAKRIVIARRMGHPIYSDELEADQPF